jgi:phosphoribosylanthranilate isomerase
MRLPDVDAALSEGADALGFVVDSPSSPRNLTLAKARMLMKAVRVFSSRVAVTSVRDSRRVLRICGELKPDAMQLHYHTPKTVHLLRNKHPTTKVILATMIRDLSSLREASDSASYSDAVLTDSPSPTGMGGTGRTYDWHLTAEVRKTIYPHPLILAGGLTPKNVRAAIREVRPYAVDVSSGVEREIGMKDKRKIREFIMNAKEAAS